MGWGRHSELQFTHHVFLRPSFRVYINTCITFMVYTNFIFPPGRQYYTSIFTDLATEEIIFSLESQLIKLLCTNYL
jgi:hypothetical protein